MADKISEIYNKALAKGVLKQGMTEEQFREKTSTDKGLRSFYDYATNHGMHFHEYDEFKERFYGGVEEPQQEVQQEEQPVVEEKKPISFWQSVASHNPYPVIKHEQEAMDEKKRMEREDKATLPLSQEDIATMTGAYRFPVGDMYGMRPDENGIPTFGKIEQPKQKEEDTKVPYKNESYLNRAEKTMDDVKKNAIEAWTANTEAGKKARSLYEENVSGASDFYVGKFNEYEKTIRGKVIRGELSLDDYKKLLKDKGDYYKEKIQNEEDKAWKAYVDEAMEANNDYINKRYREIGNGIVGERIAEDMPAVQEQIDHYKALEDSHRALTTPRGNGTAYGAIGAQANYVPKYGKESELLKEAKEILNDAKQLRDAAVYNKQLGSGFADKIGDEDTWDFGLGQAMRSVHLKYIVDKLEKNDNNRDVLTKEEQVLLDAYATYLQSMAFNSHKLSTWYKAGQTTAESLPFILQVAATSGLGIGSSLATTVFKVGFKTGQSALTRAALKGVSMATGAIVDSAIQTALFNMPKVISGSVDRQMGQMQIGINDKDRTFTFDGIDPKTKQSMMESVWNSTWDTYVENLSERILESANPFKHLINTRAVMAGMFADMGSPNWIGAIMKFSNSPVLRGIKRNIHWGGYLQEVMEEEVGGIMRFLCTDVNTMKESGLDKESQIDILAGLLPTSVAFGLIGGANVAFNYGKMVHDYHDIQKTLSTEAEKELFSQLMKESRTGEFGQLAHDYIRGIVMSDKYTPREKRTLLEDAIGRYYNVISDDLKQNTMDVAEARYGKTVDERIATFTNNQDGKIYTTVDSNGRPVVITDGKVKTVMVNERGKEVKEGGVVLVDTDGTQPKLGVRFIKPDGSIEEQPHEVSSFDLPFPVEAETPQAVREFQMAQYVAGMTGQETFELKGKTYNTSNGEEVVPEKDSTSSKQGASTGQSTPLQQDEAPKKNEILNNVMKPMTVHIKIRNSQNQMMDFDVNFTSAAYTINDDGTISADTYTITQGGKPIKGETKKKYMEAINDALLSRKERADADEEQRRKDEEYKKSEEYKRQQELERMRQELEKQKEEMRKSIPLKKNGTIDMNNATPEQIFFYNLEKYGAEEAISRAAAQVEWDVHHMYEVNSKKGLMPQEKDAQMDDSRDRIEAYYAAATKWIGPDAVEDLRQAELRAKVQETTPVEEKKEEPARETPALAAPAAKEEPKKEEPKKETPKEERKEPKQEKKPKEQKTSKVEIPQQPKVETSAPAEPAPEKPAIQKEESKAPGYEAGMERLEKGVWVIRKSKGGPGKLVKSDKKPAHAVLAQRIYLDAEGKTPYILWSTAPITSTRGNIKYVDGEGNIHEVARNSVFMENPKKKGKFIPVPAPKSINVTSFNTILNAKVKVGDKEYSILDMLKWVPTGTTKKKGGEGASYLSGYQVVAQQIKDSDLSEEQQQEALKTIREQIGVWIQMINSLATKEKMRIDDDGHLMPLRAMKLTLYRDIRDKYAMDGNTEKLSEWQSKILGVPFQVLGQHATKDLESKSFANPLYQIALYIKMAQNAGLISKESVEVSLPSPLQIIFDSKVVTPKTIDAKRKEYKDKKAQKVAAYILEDIEKEFPEVKHNLQALIRFSVPHNTGTKRKESNKAYDKDLQAVYAAMQERQDKKDKRDQLRDLCARALNAAKDKDWESFGELNKQISDFIRKNSKDDPQIGNLLKGSQNDLSAIIRTANAEMAEYDRLTNEVERFNTLIADAEGVKGKRAETAKKLKEQLEAAEYQLEEYEAKYPNGDSSKLQKKVEQIDAKLRRALELEGKGTTQNMEQLRGDLANAQAALDAYKESHPGVEEQYKKFKEQTTPANGLRLDMMVDSAPARYVGERILFDGKVLDMYEGQWGGEAGKFLFDIIGEIEKEVPSETGIKQRGRMSADYWIRMVLVQIDRRIGNGHNVNLDATSIREILDSIVPQSTTVPETYEQFANAVAEWFNKNQSRFSLRRVNFSDMMTNPAIDRSDWGKRHGEYVVNILRALGVKVNVVSHQELIAMLPEKTDKQKAVKQKLMDGKGVLYGLAGQNEIWICQEVMNPNAPIHESAHMWVYGFAQNHPEEWKKMIETLKKTEMWQRILNNSDYAEIHNDDNRMANEVLARLVGDFYSQKGIFGNTRFEEAAQKDVVFVAKIRNFVYKVLQWIFDKFNYDLKNDKNFNSEVRRLLSMPINDLIAYGGERGAVIARANAKQKQPGWIRPIGMFDMMTRRTDETIRGWLNQRDDLSEQEVTSILSAINELENTNLQLAAGYWYAKGTIELPNDLEKVRQAVKVAAKAKVPAISFDSPVELMSALQEYKLKEKPIDPETVPTLHRTEDSKVEGLVIYDVDESDESRENMRKIINTHIGTNASPWCLLQGDENGNLTEQSIRYWDMYDKHPKQAAFYNGKLVGFSASHLDYPLWWDRMDNHHTDVPIGSVDIGEGKRQEKVVNKETGESKTEGIIYRFSPDGKMKEYFQSVGKRQERQKTIFGSERNGKYLSVHYGKQNSVRDILMWNAEKQVDHSYSIQGGEVEKYRFTYGPMEEEIVEGDFRKRVFSYENVDDAYESKTEIIGSAIVRTITRGKENLRIKATKYESGNICVETFDMKPSDAEGVMPPNFVPVFKVWYDENGNVGRIIDYDLNIDVSLNNGEPIFIGSVKGEVNYTIFDDTDNQTMFDIMNGRDKTFKRGDEGFEEYEELREIYDGAKKYLLEIPQRDYIQEGFSEIEDEEDTKSVMRFYEDLVTNTIYDDIVEYVPIKEINRGEIFDELDTKYYDKSALDLMVEEGDGAVLGGENVQFSSDENSSFPLDMMVEDGIAYQYAESELSQLDEPVAERIRREEDKDREVILDPDLSDQERGSAMERMMTRAFDQTNGLRLMINSINAYRKLKGLPPIDGDKYDVRTKFEASRNIIANKIGFLSRGIEKELDDTIQELAAVVEKSEMYQKYMQEVGGNKPTTLTPIQFIERYLIARNNWERSKEGNARGLAEFKQRMGYTDAEGNIVHVGVIEFAEEFQETFGADAVTNLWNKIRQMTDFALDTDLEGGLISQEFYEELKAKKFYVPQRGFWDDVNPENEQDDVLELRKRGSSIARNKLDSMHKAEGGKSLAEGCLAYIYRDARQSIKLAEENKVKQALFYLLRDNADWCHLPEHSFKVPRQVWYEMDEEGQIVPMNDGPTDEQRAEMARLKNVIRELKQEWLKAETDDERKDIEDEIFATEAQFPYFDEKDSYRILHTRAKTNKALVSVRINGAPCEIEMTPRFLQTADALNGRQYNPALLSAIRTATSWLSAQFTINNPTFFAVNIVRDTPLILQKGAVEYGPEFSARFIANWATSNFAVWKYILSGEIDASDTGAQLRDFLMNGGNTGYSNLEELEKFRRHVADLNPGGKNSIIEKAKNIKSLEEGLRFAGQILSPVDKAVGWAELRPVAQALNEWSEIISRFAAYKSVVDMGLGINEGIHAAHNLSTNFNRRGLGDPFITTFNSLTVFANAGIQGAMGYFRTLDSQGDTADKVKKVLRTFMYMGVAPAFLGFLDTLFNPDDDDEEIGISAYDRENYIILGDRRIALNEQLKPFWVIGVNIALGMRGRRTGKEIANSIMNSMITNWLPLPQNLNTILTNTTENYFGIEEHSFWGTLRDAITPSMIQTLNQVADNKNFMGGKLRYDIGDIPEYDMAPNEARLLQDISRGFYLLGGGNRLVASKTKENGEKLSGFWDVNPKQIRNYLFWIPSGSLDNFCFAWGIFRNMQEGTTDNIRPKDIPVVNRFYKPSDKSLYRYAVVREAKAITKEYNDRLKNYEKQLTRAQVLYNETGSAEALASFNEAQRLLQEASSDVVAAKLDYIVKQYDQVSMRALQNQLGLNQKETKKYYGETAETVDEQEKRLVQMMLEGVNMKKGLQPDENNPEWVDWFDDHKMTRRND